MHRAVSKVRRKLTRKTHHDLSNLDSFQVERNNEFCSAVKFVKEIREKHRPELATEEIVEADPGAEMIPNLPPSTFRPKGQTGLENFRMSKTITDSEKEIYPSVNTKKDDVETTLSVTQNVTELNESILPDVPGATITADDRELNSAVIARLKAMGADVKIDRLLTGDFRIGERILVERKTVRDFVDSLVDGRLLEQASRIVGAAPRSLILIEGEGLFRSTRVHPHALMGALTTLTLDFGIPVVTTKDGTETARFLIVASRREESMLDGLSSNARERLESGRPELWTDPMMQAAAGVKELRDIDDERVATRDLLVAIPSVDKELANHLLDKFGTIAGLVWADEDELRQIEGISETQVREIWRTFRSGEKISHR
jgi:Fanconi anemia group M protein